MLVYKLVQENCSNLVALSVGDRVGEGSDGEAFQIIDQPDKVIKFGILSELCDHNNVEQSYQDISQALNYLIDNPHPTYARMYTHVYLGTYTKLFYGNTYQRYLLYYYTMEKLLNISDDECRVFSTLVSHEDQEKKKDYGPEKVSKILADLSRGLDFDAERVTFFCENFRKTAVRHLDVHPRNIMKDSAGNFKLIDFDRAQLLGDSYES